MHCEARPHFEFISLYVQRLACYEADKEHDEAHRASVLAMKLLIWMGRYCPKLEVEKEELTLDFEEMKMEVVDVERPCFATYYPGRYRYKFSYLKFISIYKNSYHFLA